MPITRLALQAPTIQRARILDVDISNYVCTVATEFTQKPLTWVTWMSPYEHHDNGEGLYIMPEVGSFCWIVEPSDGNIPFILGWTSIADSFGSHRTKKQELDPGDIYLGTRDENRIWLRRGGVVEIGATPLCSRLFLPVENIIRDFCENYLLQTLGGSLEWSISIPQKTKTAQQQTKLVLKARQYADDANPIATLQIGSHISSEDTILSLVINDGGGVSPQARIQVKLDRTGDMLFMQTSPDISKKVLWDLTGNFEVKSRQQIKLESLLTARLASKTLVDIEGAAVSINALADSVLVNAKGGTKVTSAGGSPALTVGAGTTPVLLATEDLLKFIQNHTHECTAPGSPSKMPTLAPTSDSITSQDIKTS